MYEVKLKFRVRHTRMNLPCSNKATCLRYLGLVPWGFANLREFFRARKKNNIYRDSNMVSVVALNCQN